MKPSRLQEWFPSTESPLISNAPMLGVVTPRLAAEVTKAGGLGFIACAADLAPGSAHVAKLDADLAEVRGHLGADSDPGSGAPLLPIGASFLTGHASIRHFGTTALPILAKHRPAAVWLFAPDGEVRPHPDVIAALKTLEPAPPRVFVQVGNVAAAREAVHDGADVVVCQGVDAGGHQFRRGAGVVSLVPEVAGMLAREFPGRRVGVVAAGGIADGRGVAAALALGAEGVVMGTRFTVADESTYPEHRKELVLETVDGGFSTLKSPFNDRINNNPLWGPLYDGRAIIGPVHEKFLAGASLEDCQQVLKDEYSTEDAAKIISTWAGTGVGLVGKRQPAGEMVKEVRREAEATIQGLAGLL